jgi:integrase
MMYLAKHFFGAVTLGLVTMQGSVEAIAATPEIMMAQCRARAGEVFSARLPDIDTKYEGQRTDGTHAVNGTAIFRGRTETFQCSFDRAGKRIIRFVVNSH